MGLWRPAARFGAASAAVSAQGPLEEAAILFITSSIVWSQANNREGTQLHPQTENWIKDLLSVAPPIRTRPGFPHIQSLHKPLTLIPQKADRTKPQSQKTNQTDHMDHSLASSMKLRVKPCRAAEDRWDVVESTAQTWPLEEGTAMTSAFLP